MKDFIVLKQHGGDRFYLHAIRKKEVSNFYEDHDNTITVWYKPDGHHSCVSIKQIINDFAYILNELSRKDENE